MKKLFTVLTPLFLFCTLIAGFGIATAAPDSTEKLKGSPHPMKISITSPHHKIIYVLNDSQASKSLVAQLPLEIGVEDYAGLEKIFYPPKKLDTTNTPMARNNKLGTLAYYAPWGDVVLFYGKAGPASGLYELGQAETGHDDIPQLSGTVRIEKE